MGSDLQLRPAIPEDTGQILDLMRLSLGDGQVSRGIEYWTWKHRENPFGPSPVLVAEFGGHIIGLRVFMRWQLRARGATWLAARAVDTATHPAWRGQGVFSRLTLAMLEDMKAEGVAVVFNTPNRQSGAGYLKLGWRHLGRTSLWVRWVRPLRPLALIRCLLGSRDSDSALDPGSEDLLGEPARVLVDQPTLLSFLDALPFSNDRLHTARSNAYFRWRYARIPGLAYRAMWSLDGDDGAVALFRVRERGRLRELRLCELLVGGTIRSKLMGHHLLHTLLSRTSAHYVAAMAARGTVERDLLMRAGFLPATHLGPVMTVRLLSDTGNGVNPVRRSDWDLSIGDLELF